MSKSLIGIKLVGNLRASNTRLLLVLLGGVVVLISYFIAHNFYNSTQKAKEEVLHRLMAIANTVSPFIDGDDHQRIANQNMIKDGFTEHNQDSGLWRLHMILKKSMEANNLKTPLYTIVYYKQDSTFHFIGTSSDKPYYRHSYKNYPKELLAHFQTGGILDTYEDENGKWLSAFAPIKNSTGEAVALLEADENFEWFMAKARKELISNALISLAVVIPFGLLLLSYLSRSLNRHVQDQEQLLQQKEEIEAQNEEIKTQNDHIENQNRALEVRVIERTAELEAANLELSNFLYHSSHDVQAPIATLKGLLQLTRQENNVVSMNAYLNMLNDTVAKLERMVKTIKLVHEVKTTSIHHQPINLNEIVRSVVDAVSVSHQKINYHLEIAENFEFTSDEQMVKNVFYELIKIPPNIKLKKVQL